MSQVNEQHLTEESNSNELVLHITGLNHSFGEGETRTPALVNINLKIYRGEIVILLGPSGCGKTTLLTLIGALRTVQDGSVVVLGQEMRGLDTTKLIEMRRRIGFIFQAHNLFSSLSALQNVMLALELQEPDHRIRQARAIEVLSLLQMGHRLHYRHENLSGGQRQRVAIARALANRPGLILADEPTAALDRETAAIVVEQFKQLAHNENPEKRSTILVVTHDEKILGMADRIVKLKEREIHSNILRADVDRIVPFLQSTPVFQVLDLDTLRRIASRMYREVFPAEHVIFSQDDEGDRFYLIWDGSVEISMRRLGRIRVLERGNVFGEMALLSVDRKRTATATTLTPVELYSMDKRDFDTTLLESPTLNATLRELYKLPPLP
jgi:putative ABC transport system ATP-binding protein